MPSPYPRDSPIRRKRQWRLPHDALDPERFIPVLLWLEETWTSDQTEIRRELRGGAGEFRYWLLALAQALGEALIGDATNPSDIQRDIGLPSLAQLLEDRGTDPKRLLLQLIVAWLWSERCSPAVRRTLMKRQADMAAYKSPLALQNQLKAAEAARTLLGERTRRRDLWCFVDTPLLAIVHVAADRVRAQEIEQELLRRESRLRVERIHAGSVDSLLLLLERRVMVSDSVLLLWSASAANAWAHPDWTAGINDTTRRVRGFVLLGLLEDATSPQGLSRCEPVTLHSALTVGIEEILSRWRIHRDVVEETMRPVVPPHPGIGDESGGTRIYVSSELFDRTVETLVHLDAPAGLLADRMRDALMLPRQFDHEGRAFVQLSYDLFLGEDKDPLDRDRSLREQGVAPGALVLLGTELRVISALRRRRVREHYLEDEPLDPAARRGAAAAARAVLQRALEEAGLRLPEPPAGALGREAP